MRSFLLAITRNLLGIVGSVLVTASAVVFLSLLALSLVGFEGGPYQGIIAFLVVPAVFGLGLVLIPLGVWLERRRDRRTAGRGGPPPRLPVIDLNQGRIRGMVFVFLVLTLLNAIILATATYKGVQVMDSTEFCGETCHQVMAPEFTAYRRSPHARVECVSCHIGPGADWFVKSKLSGAWQVVSVALDIYPRPIPTPVHDLRPARDTCEQCHWPGKFVGDRLKVISHYAEDEANTESKTVLLLRVGGIQERESHGIHWHVDPRNRIRYRSDDSRETIYDVELLRPDGTRRTYSIPLENAEGGTWREMDCVDCHNRPAHVYRMPEEEIDQAFAEGRLPASLPYLRREGLRALRAGYASQEDARRGIGHAIRTFYLESYPELAAGRAELIDAAVTALGDIHTTNVFPSMNIDWGTYPNHIGHEEFPGCFRCHDDQHADESGRTISQDCTACHAVLAWEEKDPEILGLLEP